MKYRGPPVVMDVLPSGTCRVAELKCEDPRRYAATAHASQLKGCKIPVWDNEESDDNETQDEEQEKRDDQVVEEEQIAVQTDDSSLQENIETVKRDEEETVEEPQATGDIPHQPTH